MNRIHAIGLMSGTSMDGIDIACIETDGEAYAKPLACMAIDYDSAMRARLAAGLEAAQSLTNREARTPLLDALEAEIDLAHIKALNAFLALDAMQNITPQLIGYHGQTVLHRPEQGLTIQLGKGQRLAKATGMDVVYDMRANDMRHGGQGAPLAPAYHAALATHIKARAGIVAFVNIGGISNITFVGEGLAPLAFDCGPGNALIDQWMQREAGLPYDQGGHIALEGAPHAATLKHYLADSFFQQTPPKSLDRFDFNLAKMPPLALNDGAMTLAHLTAQSIFLAADWAEQRPKTWVLCGGGRLNKAITQALAALAKGDDAEVLSSDQLGFNGDMMEAEAWAYLAVRSMRGLPLTWPSTTGCHMAVTGGVLARGE